MKVMTVVGTRPEIIRLSRVMTALDAHFSHVLVHTGQNFDRELSDVFFEEMELRVPDRNLAAAGRNAADTVANVIRAADEAMEEERPDALLVLGDTNSCLAAYPAKRRRIPVFHMEAGNRCFDFRVPEEINRRVVDHLADVNLTYSSLAREYLLREGLPPDRVIKTGSPMSEVLNHYLPKIEASDILAREGLSSRAYYVVSAHREENVDSPERLAKLASILERLCRETGRKVLFSVHPRTRARLEAAEIALPENVILHRPLGLFDYVKLEMESAAVLSDSGTLSEEAAILNFPALSLRENGERPEAVEEGAPVMTGLSETRVFEALALLENQKRGAERSFPVPADYAVRDVSGKVVRILLSYTDYVRRNVWREKV